MIPKNKFQNKKVIFIKDEKDELNADGIRGHLEIVSDSDYKQTFYSKCIKRLFDIIVSFFAIILLSPLFLILIIAIIIDDPGPVFFKQIRIGMNKKHFYLHKFRSMKKCTPHDVPTHMLENPDQYITRVGRYLRKHSIDELPQIFDIFVGNMSFVGPRPALWNQYVLIAERDKYDANDIVPGLTGIAQLNGRDELTIEAKAKLDGDYVKSIGFVTDLKCFFESIHVLKSDEHIVEGTGNKEEGEK